MYRRYSQEFKFKDNYINNYFLLTNVKDFYKLEISIKINKMGDEIKNIKNLSLITSSLEKEVIDAILSYNEIDKIRLFVFEQLKRVNLIDVFNNYWLKTEEELDEDFENFLFDYLTMQNGGLIAEKNNLFQTFQDVFKVNIKYKSLNDCIKNFYRFSKYYNQIIKEDIKNEKIKSLIHKINLLGAKDSYPYLMEVFEDYDFAYITTEMLIDILSTTIDFIKQRNQNESFYSLSNLSSQINEMLILKEFSPKIIQNDSKTINDIVNKIM